MSKDSHFTGQPVYSQVLKLLDKEKILQNHVRLSLFSEKRHSDADNFAA